MSKLLRQYEELKKQNPNVIYLFRVGIFYNILNDDEYWIENYKHFYNIPKDVELSFMDYNMWILRSVSD